MENAIGNREIKFRAWNTKGNVMVDLYKITPLALSLKQDGLFIPFGENFKLMQYTGLKDKNGKEIYEGDIITVYASNSASFIIVFEDGEFGGVPIKFTRPVRMKDFIRHSKVIGNIFENPELLK